MIQKMKTNALETLAELGSITKYALRWVLIGLIISGLWYAGGLLGVLLGAFFWSSYKAYRKRNKDD